MRRRRPSLLKLLDAGDPATTGAVAYALGELHAEEAKPRLMELLKDPGSAGARGSLMYAMMCLDASEYFHDMLDLLFDEYFEVRCKAAMILEDATGGKSIGELIAARSELEEQLRASSRTSRNPPDDAEQMLGFLSEEIQRRESRFGKE